MKRLVFLLVFLPLAQAQIIGVGTHRKIYAPAAPVTCTPVSGYAHCRILTIDHTQVGGSTLTNFPVVTQNGSTPMTLGSSRILNASCYDVVFTSDSGGTTFVPWEVESCTQGTGAVIAWVLCASCSASADTYLYVSYGNAGIFTAQNTGANGPTHVWDSNYGPVYHLGSLSLDSTSGGVTATNSGATSGTGEIDGAAVLNGSSSHLVGHQWTNYSAFTVSYWVNWTDVTGYQYMVSDVNGYGTHFISALYGASKIQVDLNTTVNGLVVIIGATTVTTGTWYHVVTVYDGAHMTLYLNGVQDAQDAPSGTFVSTVSSLEQIGGNSGAGHMVSGTMDEYEFSTTARSQGWIAAQFSNQKGGSTFLRVGAEI